MDKETVFKTPVQELMSRFVVTVSPELPIEELAQLFLERGISGAPVIDDQRKTLGVVTKTDLLQAYYDAQQLDEPPNWLAEPRDEDLRRLGPGYHEERQPTGKTVADIMTPISFSVPEDASVARAAAMMAYEGIHRLPVVDDSERIVGILSPTDLLRWMARIDGYIVSDETARQRM
jgi:CBS domain-containing protein